MLSDCTLRKEKELELERRRIKELEAEATMRAKRSFVTNVSHEIRTCVSTLMLLMYHLHCRQEDQTKVLGSDDEDEAIVPHERQLRDQDVHLNTRFFVALGHHREGHTFKILGIDDEGDTIGSVRESATRSQRAC